ncbi:MAG TPA: hypothetical protein VJS11_02530 [Acidobacteriaceae bacterium]|nr:hypothetical protein [Acidobacteriaceae bacterium]
MIAYVAYRGFTTFVILPFTEPLLSRDGLYFFLLVFAAAVSTVLSFTPRKGIAASLAAAVAMAALCFWVIVIFNRSPWRTWSDFIWFVVPEGCFALAGVCKWWVDRRPLSVTALPTASV